MAAVSTKAKGQPAGVRPRKRPGRVSRAVTRKREQAIRAAVPYAGIVAASAAADLTLGQPLFLGLGLGVAGTHAGIRLHEAHGWHRGGGKAAARRRRKYQGWASRADIRRLRRRHAALTRRLCPGTALLILGTTRPARRVAVCRENSALYIGATVRRARWPATPLTPPGSCSPRRLKRSSCLTRPTGPGSGPVWILNADGYGNIPTTLAWSPLEGCEIRRDGECAAPAT